MSYVSPLSVVAASHASPPGAAVKVPKSSSTQDEVTGLVGVVELKNVFAGCCTCPAISIRPSRQRNQLWHTGGGAFTGSVMTTVWIRRRSPTLYTFALAGMDGTGKPTLITSESSRARVPSWTYEESELSAR